MSMTILTVVSPLLMELIIDSILINIVTLNKNCCSFCSLALKLVMLLVMIVQACLVPCATCERVYHMGCLQPQPESKPKSPWRCTYCLEPHDKPPPPPPPAKEPSPPAVTSPHKTPRRNKELRNQRLVIRQYLPYVWLNCVWSSLLRAVIIKR